MNFTLYLAHRCTIQCFKYAFIFLMFFFSRLCQQKNSLSNPGFLTMTPRGRKGVHMVQISGVGDLISCRLCFHGDGEMDGNMKMNIGWRK